MGDKQEQMTEGPGRQNAEKQTQDNTEASRMKQQDSSQDLPHSFVEECLDANYLGDGALFAALHRGQFIFDETVGESSRADTRPWLKWTGHYYEEDLMGEVYQAVEDLIPYYLELLEKKEKALQELSKE